MRERTGLNVLSATPGAVRRRSPVDRRRRRADRGRRPVVALGVGLGAAPSRRSPGVGIAPPVGETVPTSDETSAATSPSPPPVRRLLAGAVLACTTRVLVL